MPPRACACLPRPCSSPNCSPDGDAQKPVVVAYKRDYEARYKAEVSTFGGHAYDGLMLAVDAIKRAGSTDTRQGARRASRRRAATSAPAASSTCRPADHMGLDLTAFRMLEVTKRQLDAGRSADSREPPRRG